MTLRTEEQKDGSIKIFLEEFYNPKLLNKDEVQTILDRTAELMREELNKSLKVIAITQDLEKLKEIVDFKK